MKIKFGLVLLSLLLPTTLVTAQLPAANQSPVLKNPTILQKIRGQYKNHVESGALALNDSMNSAALNCDGNQNILQAQASAPCNGVSVTSVAFNNASRTVESGTDKKVGVVYRYANAGTAPDGTVLDALVTVQSYSNNQDADQTTFSDADVPAATAGYDQNLQPNINQESGTLNGATSWTGAITYRIQFVVTGTSTPKRISIAATTIDNDGGGVCGGANNLRESVTLSPAPQQFLLSTTPATTQTIIGNTVQGPGTNQANIGIGPEYAAAGLYLNITEMNWTYSFTTGNTCTSANGTASANRFGSLNMSCQIDFPPGFVSFPLSGKVYNDVNGLTDSTVNGTGTGTPSGTQLYANLVDGNGFVVSSVAVNADGTYSFPTTVNGTYTVQISTTQGVESNAAPAIALPSGWVSTGENLGAAAGNDGAANGSTVNGAAVTNANFGIEQRPTAATNTATSQGNPGGTTSVTVPAATFATADTTPGTVSSIRITAFPSNATSITINGTQYTSATFPAGGVTVPTNAAGNPTQTIAVDPINGAVTVGIPFVAVDNAGVESSAAGAANVPFALSSISGNVFNDTNGLSDSTVNGTGTNAGGLFANLLDSSGNVVASVSIPAGGAYSFTGLNGGTYTVQISTNVGTVGSAAPATALPAGWVNTGENIGTAAGNDGTANGRLPVTLGATNVANFGIEQRPTANNNTSATLLNPGGTNSTAVPATTFSGTDPVTNTVSSIRITAFPSNATSITINGTQYTSATFPAGGVTVPTNAAGNPTQPILVDPSFAGSGSIVIPYVAIDNAGVESSSPANATLPVSLNPTASKAAVSGKLLSGDKPLGDTLVTLTDLGTNTKKVVRTNAAGDYSFTADSGKSYIVQPLSGKYAFDQSSRFINLTKDAAGLDFNSTAKSYHPKNDFDGDGKTDIVVYRASEGNWYVQQSSDDKFVVFHWGLPTDIPVSADFDGDGKTDFAVFRPSEGNWYIWQSKSQQMRVERFGLSSDKVLPADFDGDGKADVAVYRDGLWYVHQSSDDVVRVESFGFSTDLPLVGDYDGDGKADISVYRPEDGNWYTRRSSDYGYAVHSWGLATDVPVVGDFDGDGRADFGQFRNGDWYQLNTTTDYELNRLGKSGDQTFIGDFDGDGRADTAVYRDGVWTIRMAKDGSVKTVWFGLPTDQLVK